MEVVISVTASEKLCPRQYQSSERSVFLSAKMEIPDGDDPATNSDVVSKANSMMLRAEAQMYSSLARDFASQGAPSTWLRDAAVNRASRIGINEDAETQCQI